MGSPVEHSFPRRELAHRPSRQYQRALQFRQPAIMLTMVQPRPHRGARSWPPEQGTEGYVWHGGPDSYLLAPTNQSSRPASSPCSITCPPVENLCPPCLISEMKVAPRPGLSPSAPEGAMRPGTNMLFIAHAQEKLDDLS